MRAGVGVCVVVAVCVSVWAGTVAARPAQGCTAAQSALTSYRASAAHAKAAYFKAHASAALRKKYVAAQAAKLAKLRAAVANCSSGAGGSAGGSGGSSTPPAATCPATIGSSAYLGEGGTRDTSYHPQATGTLKAVMLFVDFPDAPASGTPQAYWDLLSPGPDWYASQSYGRLHFQITPVMKWFRMSKNSADYGFQRGMTWQMQTDYIKEAVALADPTVDFSGNTYIYVVSVRTPAISYSPAWLAHANEAITADGASLRWGATMGVDIWANDRWGWHTLDHETGHTLGEPDLYDFNFDANNYHQQFSHVGGWSIMSWNEPAGEFFAWEKYRMGWLDANQFSCVDSGAKTETITPLETSGGLKAMVVKTSDTTADVVEVRQLSGGDSGLCDRGVLVYKVDSSIATGHGPIELLTRGSGKDSAMIAKCSLMYDAPLDLGAGETSTYEDAQIKVQLLAANADGSYQVTVTKK